MTNNLFPEFGNIVCENKTNSTTKIVYTINFPTYLKREISNTYDEEYEEFKDRMIYVFKKRLEEQKKKLKRVKFVKTLSPHPQSLMGIINYNDIINNFEKENGNYIARKYKNISIILEITE